MELASMVTLEPADINFIDRAHGLGELIEKSAPEIEKTKRLPADLLDGLHASGLFRMLLPRVYGGYEVAPAMFAQTMTAIAQYDASTAWCVGQAAGCGMAAAYMDPVGAKAIWGDNPRGTVAWGPGKAKAVRDGDNFRLSGSWMFASGGRHAAYLGAHIPVTEENGELELKPDGKPHIRTFLFPAGDAPMKDIWDVVGLRGTASDAYTLENHFIPKEFMCSRDYAPERVIDTPLYQFSASNLYASGFCNVAQGVARTMLETLKGLATEKTPRQARQKLSDNQVLQTDIALCEARLRGARAFVLSELDDLWASTTATNNLSIEDRMRIRLCTTHAIHEAKWVADTVWDNAGATAIFANAAYERRFRDIHTVTQQMQGRKDHFQNVGAFMLGHPPAMASL
jgi:alkylation response protein AidB-like acyl-CoA dehydrogenase